MGKMTWWAIRQFGCYKSEGRIWGNWSNPDSFMAAARLDHRPWFADPAALAVDLTVDCSWSLSEELFGKAGPSWIKFRPADFTEEDFDGPCWRLAEAPVSVREIRGPAELPPGSELRCPNLHIMAPSENIPGEAMTRPEDLVVRKGGAALVFSRPFKVEVFHRKVSRTKEVKIPGEVYVPPRIESSLDDAGTLELRYSSTYMWNIAKGDVFMLEDVLILDRHIMELFE